MIEKNNQLHRRTIMRVIGEQIDDEDISAPVSLHDAAGRIQTQLCALHAELRGSEDEWDAERIFQILLTISATCMAAAAEHLLPHLENLED